MSARLRLTLQLDRHRRPSPHSKRHLERRMVICAIQKTERVPLRTRIEIQTLPSLCCVACQNSCFISNGCRDLYLRLAPNVLASRSVHTRSSCATRTSTFNLALSMTTKSNAVCFDFATRWLQIAATASFIRGQQIHRQLATATPCVSCLDAEFVPLRRYSST